MTCPSHPTHYQAECSDCNTMGQIYNFGQPTQAQLLQMNQEALLKNIGIGAALGGAANQAQCQSTANQSRGTIQQVKAKQATPPTFSYVEAFSANLAEKDRQRKEARKMVQLIQRDAPITDPEIVFGDGVEEVFVGQEVEGGVIKAIDRHTGELTIEPICNHGGECEDCDECGMHRCECRSKEEAPDPFFHPELFKSR